jgi:16S rRNA (guanine527-N7)-methyltransferase
MSPNAVWLHAICSQNGFEITEGQLNSLEVFAAGLVDWNKKINLISRRDEENIWTSHILHCLSLLFKVELSPGLNVLDLGTGGGLPGIPLKIARPDLSFTLLDSTQKKISVVNNLITTLDLRGVTTVWGRAEELGVKKEFHGQYDVVVARAVAPLKDLVRWSTPFLGRENSQAAVEGVRGNGNSRRRITGPTLLALKGGNLAGEVAQTEKLPQVEKIIIVDLTLKGSNQLEGEDKKIVMVEFGSTPKQKAE